MPMTVTTSVHVRDDTLIRAHPSGANPEIIVLHLGDEFGPDAYLYVPRDRVDEVCAALVAAHAESHNSVPAVG